MVFHRAFEKQLLKALMPQKGSQGSSWIRELCKAPGPPLSWPLHLCCVGDSHSALPVFYGEGGLPSSPSGKEPTCPCRRRSETQFQSLSREGPLEKGMATHSSILAWRIPRTEEPGGLPSIWSQSQTRLSDLACTHAELYTYDPHVSPPVSQQTVKAHG